MPVKLTESTEFGTFEQLVPPWALSLRAANKSPRTIVTYQRSVALAQRFLEDSFGITLVTAVTRDHLEAFLAAQLERGAASTASLRYMALHLFFKWCVEEGELQRHPMANMHPPKVPEVIVPVVPEEDIRKLLNVCEGRSFEAKRDTAILRVFLDTGIRLGECAGINLADVDFDHSVIFVMGKGRRPRAVPFGAKTAQALYQYRRLRSRHPQADLYPQLWLSMRGVFGASGIPQMLIARCAQAGIGRLHPHQLRHTAAHLWLANGGNEGDAMRLFGWRSRQMLERYGASAADARAREAHKRMALGDRF